MWKLSVTFTCHLAFPLSRYYFPRVSDNWQPVGRVSYQIVWSSPVPSTLSKLTWLSAAVAVCLVLGAAEAMSNMALLHYYLSQYQLLPEEDTDGQEICNGKPGMYCKEREKIAMRQACFCIISLLKDILNIYKTCIWLLFTLEKVHIENYATLNRKYRITAFCPLCPCQLLLFVAILAWLWVVQHLLCYGSVARTTTSEALRAQIGLQHYNTRYQCSVIRTRKVSSSSRLWSKYGLLYKKVPSLEKTLHCSWLMLLLQINFPFPWSYLWHRQLIVPFSIIWFNQKGTISFQLKTQQSEYENLWLYCNLGSLRGENNVTQALLS